MESSPSRLLLTAIVPNPARSLAALPATPGALLENDGWILVRYLVVIEHGVESFGAYVPDLPGCVAVGETREQVTRLIHEALELHIEALKADGLPLPPARSMGAVIEIAP